MFPFWTALPPNWFIAFEHVANSPKNYIKNKDEKTFKKATDFENTSPIINATNCARKCCMKALQIHNNKAGKCCAKLTTLAAAATTAKATLDSVASTRASEATLSVTTIHRFYEQHLSWGMQHVAMSAGYRFQTARFWPAPARVPQQQQKQPQQQRQQHQKLQQRQQTDNGNTNCGQVELAAWSLILSRPSGKSVNWNCIYLSLSLAPFSLLFSSTVACLVLRWLIEISLFVPQSSFILWHFNLYLTPKK